MGSLKVFRKKRRAVVRFVLPPKCPICSWRRCDCKVLLGEFSDLRMNVVETVRAERELRDKIESDVVMRGVRRKYDGS